MSETFYWHDYETFGADPQRDRPSQFAGVRTDLDFNIIDEPQMFYCKPAEDMLPHPEACLITGITPQIAMTEGLVEAEFIRAVHHEFSLPGTCTVGYNSIRFDDEVTRNTLYRNFYDPYSREWKNGNSRWDIIDVVRLTYALRPEGIEWPEHETGVPSFRLEDLTQANGISHDSAHDALSDVRATIATAKLIRDKQQKLYEYAFQHRDKNSLRALFDLENMKPVFHVSSKIAARLGCCALAAPLATHPLNPNGIIVYDLRQDPSNLRDLTPEEIQHRLYTPSEKLAEGESRIPLKVIHLNKCPIVVNSAILKTVPKQRLQQFELDGETLRKNLAVLRSIEGLQEKLSIVFSDTREAATDPDLMLYSGGFFSRSDREQMDFVREQPPYSLGELDLNFSDQRLPEMLFRYRARNYPDTLSESEMERWEQYRYQKLTSSDEQTKSGSMIFEQYFNKLQQLSAVEGISERDLNILQDLQLYGESIIPLG